MRKKTKKYTLEEFLEVLYSKYPNRRVDVIDDKYVNSRTKMKIICKDCGFIGSRSASDLMQGLVGCRKCSYRNRNGLLKTHDKFEEELEIAHNGNLKAVGEYQSYHVKVDIQCMTCNKIFDATPANLIHNKSSCPYCNESKGEKEVSRILDEMNISYVREYRFQNSEYKKYRFDFYIESHNLIIEYDGKQHYEESRLFNSEQTKINDALKNEICKKMGVNILRIPYWDFENIYQIIKDIV